MMHKAYDVSTMIVPSSARSAAAGSAAAGGTAAGGVAAGRMAASRASAGVRRSGVARNNNDAKLDDVYNVCAIIGKERGYGGSASGGCVGVESKSKNFGGVGSLGRSAAGVDCPLGRIICCVEVVRCKIIF